MSTYKIGNFGENLAVGYLLSKKYIIIEQNFKAQGCEVDIIAQNKDVLVFVEVKYRRTLQYGRPLEAVSVSKQRRIYTAAEIYLAEKNLSCNCRFDVIEIIKLGEEYEVNHIENAFGM